MMRLLQLARSVIFFAIDSNPSDRSQRPDIQTPFQLPRDLIERCIHPRGVVVLTRRRPNR
jgi:hypothetical protein